MGWAQLYKREKKSFITTNMSKPVGLTNTYQGGYSVYSDHFKLQSALKENSCKYYKCQTLVVSMVNFEKPSGQHSESLEDRHTMISAIKLLICITLQHLIQILAK